MYTIDGQIFVVKNSSSQKFKALNFLFCLGKLLFKVSLLCVEYLCARYYYNLAGSESLLAMKICQSTLHTYCIFLNVGLKVWSSSNCTHRCNEVE